MSDLATADAVVAAIYQDGAIRPLVPLDLPDGTPVTLQINAQHVVVVAPAPAPAGDIAAPVPPTARAWLSSHPLGGLLAAFSGLDLLALGGGLLLYTLTRLIGITSFPIYFFCDEAIQTTLAEGLLHNGLRDGTGALLPPFLLNADKWSLSLTVYIQLVSLALFGKSLLVTRTTSALVSILAVVAVALTLKLVFQTRFWWVGPLVLTVMPAWFIHSRTAFETVMMVAFYACFLCAYLLYRYRSPRYLPAALAFGAATFYSYTNGQGVMAVSGVLLLLLDIRYHWQQLRARPQLCAWSLALAVALAAPYLRFRFVLHPEAFDQQLRVLDSYWLRPIPLSAKLGLFWANYSQGLSPLYWFLPNDADLMRHRWLGLGHLPLVFLPLVLIGLGVCLWRWRSSAHRAVLVALLAAPFSSAIASIFVTRSLAMVVPATLLTVIGLEQLAGWLAPRISERMIAIPAAALLTVGALVLTRTALADGPTWFTNYGLYGMQYGAAQVFDAIPPTLAADPTAQVVVSPSWANNPDVYPAFFLNAAQQRRVSLGSIDGYLIRRGELRPEQLFVMTADEYAKARASGKLLIDPPQQVIGEPDGQPGFFFVHARYVDNVDALFAADREARRQLKHETVQVDGQPVAVGYSQLDSGRIVDVFDGDLNTLARGMEANPFVIELGFAQPRTIGGLSLDTARMNFVVKIIATPADGSPAQSYTTPTYRDLPGEPHIDYQLPGGPRSLSQLRIEITNLGDADVSHIHVRELKLH